MVFFSIVLVGVIFLFFFLGVLLFIYVEKFNIVILMFDGILKIDLLFFEIVFKSGLSIIFGVIFFLGLIVVVYSSVDSVLIFLIISFCVDFLNIEK